MSKYQMQAAATSGAFLIAVLVIALATVTLLPLSPEITAYVQVSTTSDGHPSIALTQAVLYQRVTLVTAGGEPKDRVQIFQVTVTTTTATTTTNLISPIPLYQLTVSIQYQGHTILYGSQNATDGFYLVKASFWPRSEQSGVPYVVVITIAEGTYSVVITAQILSS